MPFNVLEGNQVARLSRLYREMPTEESREEDKSHSIKKYPVKKEEDKFKRAPFLSGCRIVIIGGLAKWFDSVITETGAELVHEPGDHPERIHADLRRADALFMLLTATSHRATWSCIEIAKQNRVPHFTIGVPNLIFACNSGNIGKGSEKSKGNKQPRNPSLVVLG